MCDTGIQVGTAERYQKERVGVNILHDCANGYRAKIDEKCTSCTNLTVHI